MQAIFEDSVRAKSPKEKFSARLEQALPHFRMRGINTVITLNQAIALFLRANNFAPVKDFPRFKLHEACHVISGSLTGSRVSEQTAIVYEKIFLFATSITFYPNKDDKSDFSIKSHNDPDILNVLEAADNVAGLTASYQASLASDYQDECELNNAQVLEIFRQAKKQRELFLAVTGGRQLYQFSTEELDLPLAFFGIRSSTRDGKLRIDFLSEEERMSLVQALNAQVTPTATLDH